MDATNKRGQILIEVILVMALITVIALAAIYRLVDLKDSPHAFQLTEDGAHGKKSSRFNTK